MSLDFCSFGCSILGFDILYVVLLLFCFLQCLVFNAFRVEGLVKFCCCLNSFSPDPDLFDVFGA